MIKGSRRCHVCKKQATGALVYRYGFATDNGDVYMRHGAFLCQEDLEIATKANLERKVSLTELILETARRGCR